VTCRVAAWGKQSSNRPTPRRGVVPPSRIYDGRRSGLFSVTRSSSNVDFWGAALTRRSIPCHRRGLCYPQITEALPSGFCTKGKNLTRRHATRCGRPEKLNSIPKAAHAPRIRYSLLDRDSRKNIDWPEIFVDARIEVSANIWQNGALQVLVSR